MRRSKTKSISVAAAGTAGATDASGSSDQNSVRAPADCQNACSNTGEPWGASGPPPQPVVVAMAATAAMAVTGSKPRMRARIADAFSMCRVEQGYARRMSLPPIDVDDPADERLADYRLLKERHLNAAGGRFVAESER